jgi:hypothetical protein
MPDDASAGTCGASISQRRDAVLRLESEAVDDDDGLQVEVDEGREHGIFERSDDDRLVDERIVVAAQAAERLAQRRPRRTLAGRHEQDLEIRLARLPASHGRRKHVRQARLAVLFRRPGVGLVPVTGREQRHADPLHEPRELGPLCRIEPLVHLAHQRRSRIAVQLLERRELGEHGSGFLAQTLGRRGIRADQRLGDAIELAPAIASRFGSGKEFAEGCLARRRRRVVVPGGLAHAGSRMSGACGPPHARMMITVGCRCTLRPCSSRHRAIARVEKCKDDAETGAHHGGNAHTPAAHHPLRFFWNASRLIEYPQP